MKLLAVILAAAVVSAFAAVGAAPAVDALLGAIGWPSGRGLAAVLLFGGLIYVVLAAVVLGIAAFRAEPERRLRVALLALLIAPLILFAFNLFEVGHDVPWYRDLPGWIAFFAPMWVVAAIQWVILRWYIRRGAARPREHEETHG